jgi:hypothetical protein
MRNEFLKIPKKNNIRLGFHNLNKCNFVRTFKKYFFEIFE